MPNPDIKTIDHENNQEYGIDDFHGVLNSFVEDNLDSLDRSILSKGFKYLLYNFEKPEVQRAISANKSKDSHTIKVALPDYLQPEDSAQASRLLIDFYDENKAPLIGNRLRTFLWRRINDNLDSGELSQEIIDAILTNYSNAPLYHDEHGGGLTDEIVASLKHYDKATITVKNNIDQRINEIQKIEEAINVDNNDSALTRLADIYSRFFPNSFNKSLNYLSANIGEDKKLASHVLGVLLLGKYKSNEINNLLQATLKFPEIAKDFVQGSLDDHCPWINQEWYPDALKVAQDTLANNPVIQVLDYEKYGFYQDIPELDNSWEITQVKQKIRDKCANILQGKDEELWAKSPEIDAFNESVLERSNELATVFAEAVPEYANDELLRSRIHHKVVWELSSYLSHIIEHESDIPAFFANPDLYLFNFKTKWRRYYEERENDNNILAHKNSGDRAFYYEMARQNRSMKWGIEGSQNSISELLANTIGRCRNLLDLDIPLYDKLYAEYDTLKQSGNTSLLEVYLGRDGIYAFTGRRAQNLARLRAMGPKNRTNAKADTVMHLTPKYLVFPRFFRDQVTDVALREYLEFNNITESNIVFYDTGYTGSIPEQIMKLVGFSDQEINKRIYLLTSEIPERQLRGVSNEVRERVIKEIEHNSKKTMSSFGLYKDKETGKISTIQRAACPEDQFIYSFLNALLSEHYYSKAKATARMS